MLFGNFICIPLNKVMRFFHYCFINVKYVCVQFKLDLFISRVHVKLLHREHVFSRIHIFTHFKAITPSS